MFLGGKATYGSNRSEELADEIADGWEQIMTHSFDRPDATSAFLDRAATPDPVNDSTVTSPISTDDVSAALKRLKRGKAAGPDEPNNTFYRDYAAGLMRPVSTPQSTPVHWDELYWVDLLVFSSDAMMSLYGYYRPPVEQPLEYCKSFCHLVPYMCNDEPPRPLLASGMSTQAVCKPRVEMMSTVTSLRSVQPALHTELMSVLCNELSDSSAMSIPGLPLLIAYINLKDNYEDSVIVSGKSRPQTGRYVQHPLPSRCPVVQVGDQLGDRYFWFRPADNAKVVAEGEAVNRGAMYWHR